jgi:pantoate--beta-alanine ligase
MRKVTSAVRMQALSLRLRRQGRRIGFVPTMGCLHEGHLHLVRRAKAQADVVVVSIFVNRLQFGAGEDFDAYPRDLQRDLRLLRAAGADVVFCPSHGEMYPSAASSVHVEETRLSTSLCGQSRPGHFRGVTTVVAKLFNIVLPDVAVFGQKDAQQVLVVRRMVRDLNFPVRVDVAPTVRESDGLAMSSRNAYLSASERREALCLSRALKAARRMVRLGGTSTALLRRSMAAVIARAPHAAVDYIAIVDAETLEPLARMDRTALVALAVRIGRTRLIDNAVLRPGRAVVRSGVRSTGSADRHSPSIDQRQHDAL